MAGMITYRSTRGGAHGRGFEDVLLTGLAEDGGLFLPETWPERDPAWFRDLAGRPYAETAARIIAPFTGDCFDEAELEALCRRAYAGFAHSATAPLKQLGPDDWLLELFHGPTLAFKDFALQLLGLMFERVLERADKRITVVGATSGDTGSAAIAACAGLERVRICILHPHGRVSEVQRRQITTVTADNVQNIAVEGDFDDCQALVKAMFNDGDYRREMRLAAINSINWARVVAQAVYYVHAAVRLGGLERPPVFSVPTGNFGDVFAGYVAHRLGLPIKGLIVATNKNDILARFLKTGRYEAGKVAPTMSPSMDIQVASNFERLLFESLNADGAAVRTMLDAFQERRKLEVDPACLAAIRRHFDGIAVDEEETAATIARTLAETGELVDPHSAVGLAASRRRFEDADAPRITLATAHPAKFPDAVEKACGRRPALPPHMADLLEKEERFSVLPADRARIQDHIRASLAPAR